MIKLTRTYAKYNRSKRRGSLTRGGQNKGKTLPLDHQDLNDLIWIRHEFLNSTRNHGRFIVHGHTPVPHPDIRHNRINIDTGAWRTGTLTCIAIEGSTILFL